MGSESLVIICSNDSLLHIRHHIFARTFVDLLSIGLSKIHYKTILFDIQNVSFKKIYLKIMGFFVCACLILFHESSAWRSQPRHLPCYDILILVTEGSQTIA